MVNGMLWMRPTPSDFGTEAGWPAERWSWDAMKPHFDQLEEDLGITNTPSLDGKQYLRESAEVFEAALASSGLALGVGNSSCEERFGDGAQHSGTSGMPCVIASGGQRQNSASVYLVPTLQRPNFSLMLNTEVTRCANRSSLSPTVVLLAPNVSGLKFAS